jgi:hypothetical protein
MYYPARTTDNSSLVLSVFTRLDESLLDIDDITGQVSAARPIGGKSEGMLHRECCCQEHCNCAMHISSQVKHAVYEKEADEMREVAV